MTRFHCRPTELVIHERNKTVIAYGHNIVFITTCYSSLKNFFLPPEGKTHYSPPLNTHSKVGCQKVFLPQKKFSIDFEIYLGVLIYKRPFRPQNLIPKSNGKKDTGVSRLNPFLFKWAWTYWRNIPNEKKIKLWQCGLDQSP